MAWASRAGGPEVARRNHRVLFHSQVSPRMVPPYPPKATARLRAESYATAMNPRHSGGRARVQTGGHWAPAPADANPIKQVGTQTHIIRAHAQRALATKVPFDPMSIASDPG